MYLLLVYLLPCTSTAFVLPSISSIFTVPFLIVCAGKIARQVKYPLSRYSLLILFTSSYKSLTPTSLPIYSSISFCSSACSSTVDSSSSSFSSLKVTAACCSASGFSLPCSTLLLALALSSAICLATRWRSIYSIALLAATPALFRPLLWNSAACSSVGPAKATALHPSKSVTRSKLVLLVIIVNTPLIYITLLHPAD